MTLGCFCSLPTSTNQRRRLKICKSSEFTSLLLAFWNYLDIFLHHGTKRIGQGSIC